MDPIILAVVAVIAIIILLRIFFGVTKFVVKVGLMILLVVVLWRVFFAG